jgi:hypothetical protein
MLVNDIEEEIGITDSTKKRKPYLAVEHISDATFVRTDTLTEKIQTIYA